MTVTHNPKPDWIVTHPRSTTCPWCSEPRAEGRDTFWMDEHGTLWRRPATPPADGLRDYSAGYADGYRVALREAHEEAAAPPAEGSALGSTTDPQGIGLTPAADASDGLELRDAPSALAATPPAVLALIPEGAVLVTEETLTTAMNVHGWVFTEEDAAAILRHLREQPE